MRQELEEGFSVKNRDKDWKGELQVVLISDLPAKSSIWICSNLMLILAVHSASLNAVGVRALLNAMENAILGHFFTLTESLR